MLIKHSWGHIYCLPQYQGNTQTSCNQCFSTWSNWAAGTYQVVVVFFICQSFFIWQIVWTIHIQAAYVISWAFLQGSFLVRACHLCWGLSGYMIHMKSSLKNSPSFFKRLNYVIGMQCRWTPNLVASDRDWHLNGSRQGRLLLSNWSGIESYV